MILEIILALLIYDVLKFVLFQVILAPFVKKEIPKRRSFQDAINELKQGRQAEVEKLEKLLNK